MAGPRRARPSLRLRAVRAEGAFGADWPISAHRCPLLGGDWSDGRADSHGDGHVFDRGQSARLSAGTGAEYEKTASHDDPNHCECWEGMGGGGG